MPRWSRSRQQPPADVVASLDLAPGERVLAGAVDATGGWQVGTDRALHLSVDGDRVRLPWHRVDSARWDRDGERLVVVGVADFGHPQPTYHLEPGDARDLLQLVRERVTASVLMTRRVPVAGRRGLTVVARRLPGSDDPPEWSVRLDDGLDPTDPAVRAAAQRGLDEARAELVDG